LADAATPVAMAGFHATDPERFWIDTGLSGTIKEQNFHSANNRKNDLGLTRPGQALRKMLPIFLIFQFLRCLLMEVGWVDLSS